LQISLLFSAIGYLWLGFQDLFIWILLVNSFRTLASAGISPLSNLLAVLVTDETRSGFGSVRVWASIGWTAVVFLGGWLIGAVGFQTDFIGTFVVKILAMITLLWVTTEGFVEKQPKESMPENLKHVIRGLLRKPVIVAVASLIFLCGFFNSGVQQFEIVYLSQLGASELLLGVAAMLGSGLEIPAMFWADRILRRRDPYSLLIITMLIYVALRGFVFGFPSIVTVMIERALNGISFSFYVVARVRFISENTIPSETGTVLALLTTSMIYFYSIFGTSAAGYVFDTLGPRWLYVIAAFGYLASFVILLTARSRAAKA
jgi:PPP family 3-phenylpropionic acid transporter